MTVSNFRFWGWDKKPKTKLRFIKPGDIFCFKLDEQKYCFGRVMSKIMTGHVAEIFNYQSKTPEINEKNIYNAERLLPLMVIDTYSLFDMKIEDGSDWRIIGHQDNYNPDKINGVYFTYGEGDSCKKVDIFDNETSISEKESKLYPKLSPHGDYDIKHLINFISN